MSNGSERKVAETAVATSFCIEDQGETEREKKRNCWQRIRSAFYHCFENITDCFDFWFCKNECCHFCCSCDDYDEDDENERNGVAPALIRSEQNLEEKGITNDAVGIENEEFSSLEIHAVSLDSGGDGDFKGGNNSEKSEGLVKSQPGDQKSSGAQRSDLEVCGIGGGGDAENTHQASVGHHTHPAASDSGLHASGGERTNHGASYLGSDSGGHNPSVGHHTNHRVSDSGGLHSSEVEHTNHGASDSGGLHSSEVEHTNHGASDSGNNSGGHHTNHEVSYSGSDSGVHHTSGGDYVSDFGGSGD